MIKAYFVDLDNTIYFTKPNVEVLLGPLYRLLAKEDVGIDSSEFEKAKNEMLHTPFQKVAEKYHFKQAAVNTALAFLKQKELTQPMDVHNEYHFIKALKGLKFIITAGFEKTQRSKVKMLGVDQDFDQIFVVDVSKETKKDVFKAVMQDYGLEPNEVLVIGDDADSEIKFGLELGLHTFLFDPAHRFPGAKSTYTSTTLADLKKI